jgi:hypothetical protein
MQHAKCLLNSTCDQVIQGSTNNLLQLLLTMFTLRLNTGRVPFKVYPIKKHCALHLSVSENMFKSTDTCILNNVEYSQYVCEYICVLYPLRYQIQ